MEGDFHYFTWVGGGCHIILQFAKVYFFEQDPNLGFFIVAPEFRNAVKKITALFGNFFQIADPPPFGNPLFKNKIEHIFYFFVCFWMISECFKGHFF